MKKLRMILVVLGLISLGTTLAAPTGKSFASVNFIQRDSEITAGQIGTYLIDTGHELLCRPHSSDGGYTWTCFTKIGDVTYLTTVYTDGVNIVGYEDEMVG